MMCYNVSVILNDPRGQSEKYGEEVQEITLEWNVQ